ncbi:MAG TPA: redoxin domain-containing protein [Tepidisphaeraceae bacterium]|jgi:peroxiredoxin|nr:redoxin domain-containing protein [Tepidisphaeraceae bacterium]
MTDQLLKVGDAAPDFEMMNQDKTPVKLSSFRGQKKVVLLFYPMDFSPVCTDEHCAFGPQLDKITAGEDAVVFGVSTDSPFCHAAFKKQYGIPYDLLADVNRTVSKAYNLFWGDGPFNCSKRGTVVIGKDGKIAYWHEQPTREARSVEDLTKAVAS